VNKLNFKFLNKPFTLLDRKADRYLLIGIVFLFCVIFLNVFEPFNIARWYSDSGFIQFLRLSSYGFVIALVFLFTQFPLRRIFKIQHFTFKTWVLWLLTEIALINVAYIFLYGNPIGNFKNDLLFSAKYTLMSIWLPYSFAVLILYFKKHQEEIEMLKNVPQKLSVSNLVVFKDENGKIRYSVRTPDLLLLESTDNYVTVFYMLENKLQRILLRNSLKTLESELKNNGIVRCHRSFMINPNSIEFMQRDGKKFLLKLKNIERKIPVSEKYSSLFLTYLS
jgi:hypothetical protein